MSRTAQALPGLWKRDKTMKQMQNNNKITKQRPRCARIPLALSSAAWNRPPMAFTCRSTIRILKTPTPTWCEQLRENVSHTHDSHDSGTRKVDRVRRRDGSTNREHASTHSCRVQTGSNKRRSTMNPKPRTTVSVPRSWPRQWLGSHELVRVNETCFH